MKDPLARTPSRECTARGVREEETKNLGGKEEEAKLLPTSHTSLHTSQVHLGVHLPPKKCLASSPQPGGGGPALVRGRVGARPKR